MYACCGGEEKKSDYAKNVTAKKLLVTTEVDETALDEHSKPLHTSTGIFYDSG